MAEERVEDRVRTAQIEARARNISHNVRCLECGHQSIEESQADIAVRLRKVRHLVGFAVRNSRCCCIGFSLVLLQRRRLVSENSSSSSRQQQRQSLVFSLATWEPRICWFKWCESFASNLWECSVCCLSSTSIDSQERPILNYGVSEDGDQYGCRWYEMSWERERLTKKSIPSWQQNMVKRFSTLQLLMHRLLYCGLAR